MRCQEYNGREQCNNEAVATRTIQSKATGYYYLVEVCGVHNQMIENNMKRQKNDNPKR